MSDALYTKVVEQADGSVLVGKLFHDDEASDYEWMEGDSFREFRTEWDRDAYIEELKAEGVDPRRIFIVDKYDHSAVHYSVADTAPYPDRRWDVAPCGVLVVDRDGEMGWPLDGYTDNDGKFHSSTDNANALLDDYSSWCNGYVYGYVVTKFPTIAHYETAKINEGDDGDVVDSCWQFIGYDYAVSELDSILKQEVNA